MPIISPIQRKESHRNISDVKIPICIHSLLLLPLCFPSLATWHSNATRSSSSSSSRRGKQKKTKLKRRRSKSRSYTLLCLAKSWLKAPERESSRKKTTNDSSFFIFQEGLTNYDNCQTYSFKKKTLEFYCKLHLVEMWSLKVEESLASCTTTT